MGNMVSKVNTYRGQINFRARSPSGMKLMIAMDDFIPSFIFRKMEQLEAMAVTCHTPANCSRTSPAEFGSYGDLPRGPAHLLVDLAAHCRNLPTCSGPATVCGDLPSTTENMTAHCRNLPPSVGTSQANMGTSYLPACKTPCPAPC